jgi:hypothetical protein
MKPKLENLLDIFRGARGDWRRVAFEVEDDLRKAERQGIFPCMP